MKIAMITSECQPFIKTGGLADVIYSLSKELVVFGEEVAVFLPLYNSLHSEIHTESKKVATINVSMNWRRESSNIYCLYKDGISFYFIENKNYFERDNIYGYFDDGERFAFFSLACYKAMMELNFRPDIVHVHDWSSAMLPCLIKTKNDEFYRNTKTVLSIHNPAFLGILDRNALYDLYGLDPSLFDSGQVRFYDKVSTLKAGIVFADKILTVSPTHREELLTPEGSKGLDGALRMREYDFKGILNGLDYVSYDPNNDENIDYQYNIRNFSSSRKKNKTALCEGLGLNYVDGKPLFAMVSRITWQKGMDLMFDAVEELVKKGSYFILLGSGEYDYEHKWEELRSRYPDNIALFIGYNEKLAHKIYSSADFFLMPSLFEPCGLGQMIAQRYGSLPIVRLTGGLKDSVINFDNNNLDVSNGFGFTLYSKEEMIKTCLFAYDIYQNKPVFEKLIRNAMKTDHTWTRSVKEYEEVYKNLVR